MKKVSMSGSLRENVGKKDTKALRNADRVPCVMYGGEKQIHFSVEKLAIEKLVHTPNVYQIELSLGENTYQAVIKDLQFHPLSDIILHVDFQEVLPDKMLKVKLPVRTVGNSIGVRNGGKLLLPFRRLTLKGLPEAMPDDVEIDITKLRIGGKIRVSDIKLDNVSILEPADTVVVLARAARKVSDEEEEEGVASQAE